MTAKEAYRLIEKGSGELIECCDFGKFFGFIFGEKDHDFATAYWCIDKETRKQFGFSPFDDFDVYDKGVQIPVSEVIA